MTDPRENVFQMLDDEETPPVETTGAARKPTIPTTISPIPASISTTTTQDTSDSNNNSWTDVSSTRTRRLAPQCTLTKQDFAPENPRTPKGQTASHDADKLAKKKVARHPRDELLSLRRRSKILPEMADITDIVSIDPLEPECWKGITAEEILRLWSVGNDAKPGAGRGRGRGRGRHHGTEQNRCNTLYDIDNGLEEDDEGGGADMWDDCGDTAEGLDLADFAAATLKFSSESKQAPEHSALEEEDIMESLIQEEKEKANVKTTRQEEYVAPVLTGESTNKFKSSLLMQALQPEKATEVDKAPATLSVSPVEALLPLQPAPAAISVAYQSSLLSHDVPTTSPDISIKAKSLLAPPQSTPTVVEWLYRDPQNNIQGPFDNTSMRRWLECGYFKENLPIKLSSWQHFHPLGEVFANPSIAFRTVIPNEPGSFPFSTLGSGLGALASPANRPTYDPLLADSFQFSIPTSEILQHKPIAPVTQPTQPAVKWDPELPVAEKQTVTRPELSKLDVSKISATEKSPILLPVTPITKPDAAAPTPAPAAPSSPAEPVEVVPAADVAAVGPANSASTQKKSKKKDKPVLDVEAPAVVDPPEVEAKIAVPKAPVWGKTEKAQVSLKQIQEEESMRREAEPPAPATMSSQLKSLLGVGGGGKGASVWGVKASSGPSLREIQEQQQSQHQDADTFVAPATNTSKWSAPTTTVSLTDIMSEEAKKSNSTKGPAPTSWAAKAVTGLKPEPPRTVATAPSSASTSTSSKPSVTSSVAQKNVKILNNRSTDASLDWCSQQLKKIKGDEPVDLTLIEYCMSIDSAIEIREIFAQYLGSTPQVSHFATEFIRRKEGKPVSSSPLTSSAIVSETKKPLSNQFVVAGKKKKKASA